MPPPLIFDIHTIDLNKIMFDVPGIEQINPHRGHMRMLDGVCWVNQTNTEAVAFKDIRDDEFWVAGHIPGRPLFPGVLMIEAGAQLASFLCKKQMIAGITFLGFTGAEEVKFRAQVVPGDRLYLLCKQRELRPRRFTCSVQGLVGNTLVFEALVIGMPM